MSDGFGDLRSPPGGASTRDRPWYFEDVIHDYDTADDLVHGLSYGAMGLTEALALLEHDIPIVVEDWEGGARLVFDEQMRTILTAGHQLVAVLFAAGSSVMATYESAHLESGLRAELQTAYEAETSAAD